MMRLLPLSAAVFALAVLSIGECASAAPSALAATSFGEYQIKAGFIYKFISFVSWPEDQLGDGTITIGILGKSPFGEAFKSVEDSMVGSHVVKIRYFASGADFAELKTCQILYIVSSKENRLTDIFKALGDSHVLTVSDSKGFIDQGGMIGFVTKQKARIGIEINVAVARQARLTLRSMLKRIAVRIIDEPDRIGGNRRADAK